RGVEIFERAIELNGGTNPKYYIPDAYFYVGFVRLEDGDVETAKAYLQLAYDLYTMNSQSSIAQSRMRRIAEALQELNAQWLWSYTIGFFIKKRKGVIINDDIINNTLSRGICSFSSSMCVAGLWGASGCKKDKSLCR